MAALPSVEERRARCVEALERGRAMPGDAKLDVTLRVQLRPLGQSRIEIERKQHAVELIRVAVQTRFPEAALEPFGSTRSGLATRGSDVDVHCDLHTTSKSVPSQVRALARLLPRALPSESRAKVVAVLAQTRVPLIKLSMEHDVRVDLTFSSEQYGVYNSDLIGLYCREQRVAQVVKLVKLWAKLRGVGDASKGYLSSYSWTLLVLAFMQRLPASLGAPLLPNLQDAKRAPMDVDVVVGPYRIAYSKEFTPVGKAQSPPLGTLLRLFFAYLVAFDWETRAVTIAADEHGKPGDAPAWSLAIMDPFETDRDLGSTLQGSKPRCTRILDEAFKAFRALERAGEDDVRNLFAPRAQPRGAYDC